MTAYQLRIVPTEHDPRVLPVAEVYLACTFGDCRARFDLPSAAVPSVPVFQPSIADLHDLAAAARWSWVLGKPRCPAHPHGHALGLKELEPPGVAHRRVQAITDTQRLDVDAVKAALEEGEDDE